MKIIVIIPAREGSKGLPGKNLKKLCGKPLVDYSILKALEIFDSQSIILTSDSIKILERGKKYGIRTIHRPKELASDRAQIIDTIFHTVNFSKSNFNMKCENIMLLQPTFPIRKTSELKEAISYFEENNLSSLVSVLRMKEHPCDCISIFNDNFDEWKYLLDPNKNTNRQSYSGDHFFISGNFYIAKTEFLKNNKGFLFKQTKFLESKNHNSVDIDDLEDFEYAEYCISRIKK